MSSGKKDGAAANRSTGETKKLKATAGTPSTFHGMQGELQKQFTTHPTLSTIGTKCSKNRTPSSKLIPNWHTLIPVLCLVYTGEVVILGECGHKISSSFLHIKGLQNPWQAISLSISIDQDQLLRDETRRAAWRVSWGRASGVSASLTGISLMAMCAFTYNILGAPYYTSYTPKTLFLLSKPVH